MNNLQINDCQMQMARADEQMCWMVNKAFQSNVLSSKDLNRPENRSRILGLINVAASKYDEKKNYAYSEVLYTRLIKMGHYDTKILLALAGIFLLKKDEIKARKTIDFALDIDKGKLSFSDYLKRDF